MKLAPAPAVLSPLARRLDALLPQTQCGRCGHAGGCAPYARSMADGEAANRCPPGGQAGADALADALGRPRQALDPACGAPDPVSVAARVVERLCIGCGICLDACPVDAIVGARGVMHVVDSDACTGCRLCLPPCPMDCIEIVDKPLGAAAEGTPARADAARARFVRRQARVARRVTEKSLETARRRASRHAVQEPSPATAPALPTPTSAPVAAAPPDDPVARALARLRASPPRTPAPR